MKKIITFVSLAMFSTFQAFSQGIIINHTCTKIEQIPESAIQTAKQNLHIAYGHTSHGSQLTEGMDGLVTFMNGKGYTKNLYSWNNGGTAGALDLHDSAMDGDVGYYPDWVNNTRNYLGAVNPVTGRGTGANADVNVIIWSWCGQVTGKYQEGTLQSEYINPMVKLETDYFGIKFVYMTGHLDHAQDADNKAANKVIRDHCLQNNKILYDYADIESYNPDGNFFQFADYDCNYYASATGNLLRNWATEWQNSHTVNVDWYSCVSAHTEPLNANQKAYAAWWLWARLAGWNLNTGIKDVEQNSQIVSVFPNPANDKITLVTLQIKKESILTICNINGQELIGRQIKDSNTQIDISNLTSGVYFLKLITEKTVEVRKIIKKAVL